MGLRPFELVDENGRPHGPFSSREEMCRYVDSRGLGEQRNPNDERSGGWDLQITKLHRY